MAAATATEGAGTDIVSDEESVAGPPTTPTRPTPAPPAAGTNGTGETHVNGSRPVRAAEGVLTLMHDIAARTVRRDPQPAPLIPPRPPWLSPMPTTWSSVRFLYADHGGIIRGKAATRQFLPERIASGIGHSLAMMAMTMLDTLQPVDGMGPVGEVRIKPDPDTLVALPYAPGAGAMLADLVKPDGEPWEACAGTFLKQAIADLAAEGYAMSAAFEPEFTLGRASPTRPADRTASVPLDDSLCYSATGFHQGARLRHRPGRGR